MNKKILVTALWCLLGCWTGLFAQEYRKHLVKPGETLFSISRQYEVSTQELYQLNPEARKGLKPDMLLLIPEKSNREAISFKKHRVKRRETIFGIAQEYGVEVADIKRYNKELYSRPLKKGERLRIPVFPELPEPVVDPAPKEHTRVVKSKETLYGIARQYGITVGQLREMNPALGDTLLTGTVLKVPETSLTETALIDESKFFLYEVQPKEGFFRLKVKFGLDQEVIVGLNPYAAQGLKEGMILKLPRPEATTDVSGGRLVDLETLISDRSPKRLAVLLPFQLRELQQDSLEYNSALLEKNGAMRVALDFYSGVLMAAEFAREKGIPVQLDIYDTAGEASRVSRIIAENDLSGVDAVIGPLLRTSVERAAADLKRTDTPIFSPLSNREIKISANLFQTLPTDEMLQEAMLEFLKDSAGGKDVYIVSDSKHLAQRNALLGALPGAQVISPREKGFLYATDISERIKEEKENWFVLASADPVIVSNVVGLLNGLPEEFRVRLFTLDRNNAFSYSDVSNEHLAKLQFTFPSVSKGVDLREKNAFLLSYQNRYGVLPNRFAIRGFDVTYDVLLRLAMSGDVYKANDSSMVTEYTENKFSYSKKLFSGYQNRAFYIIRYTDDLQFEVIK